MTIESIKKQVQVETLDRISKSTRKIKRKSALNCEV